MTNTKALAETRGLFAFPEELTPNFGDERGQAAAI
jgi:hypothetical protein